MGIVDSFPKDWLTTVTVYQGAGARDLKGNPKPGAPHIVPRCLIAPRTTTDDPGFTDTATSQYRLYRDPKPHFRFRTGDIIHVPEPHRLAGHWKVIGTPNEWPLGTEVLMERTNPWPATPPTTTD